MEFAILKKFVLDFTSLQTMRLTSWITKRKFAIFGSLTDSVKIFLRVFWNKSTNFYHF